jgi:pimeloyl-ACP methyl ester carboxylesterase
MTLYIIHGWTYNIKPWDKTVSALKKLGVNAVLLKVPGLTARSDKTFTIKDYVKWADENIPDGAMALGHSNGGRILLNLLQNNPRKLKKLILLDSAGIYEPTTRVKILRIASKVFFIFGKVKILRKILYKIIGASDYNQAPPNMKKTLDNMIQSDKNLNLSKVSTQTAIIWGEDDKTTPLRQGLKIHEDLPNSTLKVIKGWSHSPYFNHPEALAKEISIAMKDSRQ